MGYIHSHRLTVRFDFLKKYLSFVKYLETEIRYSNQIIYEIIKSFEDTGQIGTFINMCCNSVKKGDSLSQAWSTALYQISNQCSLTKEDIEIIKDFGTTLGKSDTQGQVSYCKLNQELIALRIESALEEKTKKSKLYFTLWFFGGLSLSLILL